MQSVIKSALITTVSISLLAACGGSNSGTTNSKPEKPTPTPTNQIPVAVLDKTFISTNINTAIQVSAQDSFDLDNDKLIYQWKIENKPDTSKAIIKQPTQEQLNFTPDVAGSYTISMTVSDGKATNMLYLQVRAIGDIKQSIVLNFVPSLSKYSQSLDKLISVDEQRNQLKIIDLVTKSIVSIKMPDSILSVQLSPNGKLASVLLDGQIHLINLASAKVIQKRSTDGQHTDALITDNEIAYAIGQIGGQWVNPAVTRINMKTGDLKGFSDNPGLFYGVQKGVFADKLNKIFVRSYGLSPADISYANIDTKTNDIISAGDSPYHGEYDVGTKLWLNRNQDLLFTNAGTYFYTNSLKYAGRLKIKNIENISSSSNDDELMVTSTTSDIYDWTNPKTFADHYATFTGFKFNDEKIFNFPIINEKQSYGLATFYSKAHEHVAIVQIGSNLDNDNDIVYYVITR